MLTTKVAHNIKTPTEDDIIVDDKKAGLHPDVIALYDDFAIVFNEIKGYYKAVGNPPTKDLLEDIQDTLDSLIWCCENYREHSYADYSDNKNSVPK